MRACAILLLLLAGCAATTPSSRDPDSPARTIVSSGLEEISIVALGME